MKPIGEQHALKIESLREVWQRLKVRSPLPEKIQIRSVGTGSSRDRVDLMIDRRTNGTQRLGLFDRFKTGIVDLQGCPQLSGALEKWFQDFRQINFPIERGSVRLRVAPDGQRGVWLDFANLDIKNLLAERTTLESLLSQNVIVEIGQKRKRLVRQDDGLTDKLKLGDAVLYPWFETYIDAQSIPLYTTIGNFTQPGFGTNRILIDEVMSCVGSGGSKAAEFGAGIGNFTLPLASRFQSVDVYEVDALALTGLARTLSEQNMNGVTLHTGNYQGDRANGLDFSAVNLLFVDPPRSGLMKFLDPLAQATLENRPEQILYVSCFAESFAADSERIFGMGYRLMTLSIVDQFPQSRHFETIAHFAR